MCGIAGRIAMDPLSDKAIATTLDQMKRRGPDHRAHRRFHDRSGQVIDLMHARLSIIDCDPRANQPMQVGDKSVVFNGELYNYREIRERLALDGYTPRTESDTEILVAAIDRYGWSILDELEGMWAFALFDQTTGQLTLCRDRFGEKPLYLFKDGEAIYFGSEIKLLQAMLSQPLSVNRNHLIRYLVNGYKSLYKSHGETFFDGVSELPPAHTLTFESSKSHVGVSQTLKRYWTPKCEPDSDLSYEDAVEGAREHLIRSVELRLRADVPIAFCMSGGVDSNTLISIAKRVFDYDVHGFTIVNQDERYEEQDVIEQSVRELGIRHTNIPVDPTGFLPKLRELVRYHDSPVYTITYFAHWLLMQSVSEHGYRISVSGTAADELFTGYFDHHLFYLSEVHQQPAIFERGLRGWEEQVKPIVRNPLLRDPYRLVNDPANRDHIYLNADEFASWLKDDWHEPFDERHFSHYPLRNRMLNELFHEATPVILHEDDLNAMYYSIENRSPFLDRGLFEHCNSIPSQHLIRDGFAKVVLRDSMRGIVPDCVLDNPRKVGFNAPIFSYLDVNSKEVRESLLDESPIFDIIDRAKIEDVMNRDQLPNSASKFLFYFITSKMFLEEFEHSGFASLSDSNRWRGAA